MAPIATSTYLTSFSQHCTLYLVSRFPASIFENLNVAFQVCENWKICHSADISRTVVNIASFPPDFFPDKAGEEAIINVKCIVPPASHSQKLLDDERVGSPSSNITLWREEKIISSLITLASNVHTKCSPKFLSRKKRPNFST